VELGERRTAVRLRPYADSGDLVQVGTGQEYFLLENRGPTGDDYIDRDIDGRGLSITHVNLRKAPTDAPDAWPLRLGGGCVNCDVWGPMLMNEQADSKFELQRPGSRRDDAHDLFHAGDSFVPNLENTNPIGGNKTKLSSNLINGAVSGVSVTNVRIEGDDILVDVAVEEPCALLECGAGTCEAGKCIPPEVDDTPDEPGTNNATNNGESPDPAANAATGKTDDGCATVPAGRSPLALLLGLAGLVWALRR